MVWSVIECTSQSLFVQTEGTVNYCRYVFVVLGPVTISIIQALQNPMFQQENARRNGKRINVWSTNKYSIEWLTAVSVAFSVPASAHSKNWWKTALIYSFTVDPTERGGAKG